MSGWLVLPTTTRKLMGTSNSLGSPNNFAVRCSASPKIERMKKLFTEMNVRNVTRSIVAKVGEKVLMKP